ncbi:hypothetical protein [Phyllobacterium sophorae]|nr:hypothetical protein [Phyllobacterium sophorae]
MMGSRKNWRSGFPTALMFMIVISAIMQSETFAPPLITTPQHVHVEQGSGKTARAGETTVLNVGGELISLFGDAIEQNCEQHCLSGFYLPESDLNTGQATSRLVVTFADQHLKRRHAETSDRPPKTVV